MCATTASFEIMAVVSLYPDCLYPDCFFSMLHLDMGENNGHTSTKMPKLKLAKAMPKRPVLEMVDCLTSQQWSCVKGGTDRFVFLHEWDAQRHIVKEKMTELLTRNWKSLRQRCRCT